MLKRIGPFVWLREDVSIRRAMSQLLALDRTEADYDSENAQCARECASADAANDDPEPGALYGAPTDTEPEAEPAHA